MDQDYALLPIGTRVDQYEIIGHLGRGGFGITYKVHDPGLRREFALKEFFPADLVVRDGSSVKLTPKSSGTNDYQWALRKFYGEARLLAQFNHPNIVSVQRIFEANNSAYILLDFIHGVTLETWLRGLKSPPTQEELDLIAGPLLGALELVHQNRSWHLDVSPENVMIRASDGAPILLDFGASRFEIKQHSQLVSAMVFKSGYSAPEQYTSNADRYGPWTDIYATGATFYRAIAGDRPVEATSRTIADDLVPATVVGKGRYRDSFLRAIDWALQTSPPARPQSIAAWRSALLGSKPAASTQGGQAAEGPRPAWVERVVQPVGGALRAATSQLDRMAAEGQRQAGSLARQYRANPQRTIRLSLVPAALMVFLVVSLLLDPFGPGRSDLPPSSGIKASSDSIVSPPTSLPTMPPQQPPGIDLPARPTAPGRSVKLPVKLSSLVTDAGKGWLGAHLVAVEPPMAQALGLANTKGAIVREFDAAGPAGRAGVRVGDVVLGIDGGTIDDVSDLRRRVLARPPGTEVSLELWRPGGEGQSLAQTLTALAEQGNAHVMSWLGHLYASGLGVAQSDVESVRWYRRGASAGDAASMLGLANMMAAGRGTERDVGEAKRYLQGAGRAGSLEAFERLATLHIENRRRNSEIAPAMKMYEALAESNHAPAMVRLGGLYQIGLGVRKNSGEALRWFKRAADLGDAGGIADLGAMHYQGSGVEKDQREAVALFRRAAELGNLTAIHNLAAAADAGAGGEARDPERAADLVTYTLSRGFFFTLRHITEASRTWSREFRGAMQRRLQEAKLYSGPIDGEFRGPTVEALKALYERHPHPYCNV